MTPSRVPVARPPHDPTSLLLDGRVGWRAVQSTDVEIGSDGALRLMPLLAALPPMGGGAGTFGGLVLPSHVAVTDSGVVLLLDRATRKLLAFDRCACAFVRLPGGTPWLDPRGIAVHGDSLYVCDPAAERVVVLSLVGLAPRGALRPPTQAHPHWEPIGVAVDGCGRVFVTDRSAGLVHCFDRRGRWQKALAGFATPTWLTIDCRDRILVSIEGPDGPAVRVTDADGIELSLPLRPDLLASCIPALPFAVDVEGRIELGPLCAPAEGDAAGPSSGWFDEHGNEVPAPVPAPPAWAIEGEVVLGPLDSRIARCIWHRIVLAARLPQGTALALRTFTAEQPYTDDQLALYAQWTPGPVAHGDAASWDCLVRSGAGRYAWLALTLTGAGGDTPAVDRIEVEFPRIGSRRYLPAAFGKEPESADFTDRFLALFDTPLRSIEHQIDHQARLFDPRSTPATRVGDARVDFLSWLASWVGVSLDRRWSEEQRRRFVLSAGKLFDQRGTLQGLRQQLELVLGLSSHDELCPSLPAPTRCGCPPTNCAPGPEARPFRRPPLVLEHFRLRRWLWLGAGRLGQEAVLWGNRVVDRAQVGANARLAGKCLVGAHLDPVPDPLRDPFQMHAHRFSVFVPCRFREDKPRRALEQLLRSESPGHTEHRLVFVEPRFRIGFQSMLGFDAVVGAVPSGVRLGDTKLEGSTVLSSRLGGGQSPLAVGRHGRVGTSTRLG